MNKNHLLITGIFKGYLLLFFLFSLNVYSCAKPQEQNDFYLGLLALQEDPQKKEEAVKFFEFALSSSNVFIKRAAAGELANMMASGTELSSKTERRVRKEAHGFWAAAFDVINNKSDNEKVLELFLEFDQRIITPEARRFVLREYEKKGVSLSKYELAAIEGSYADTHLSYNEALAAFRAFQEDESWPEKIPELFIKFPLLINDLGRAFQYTSSGLEGRTLFLQWEHDNLNDDIRYRLLFYAARIARRNGRNTEALSLFQQALLLSPDSEQANACIWYILDLSLGEDSDFFIQKLEQVISYTQGGSSFNQVLERFLQRLVSAQQWKNVIHVYNLIHDTNSSVKAAYAWVIARVFEEGFLSNEEKLMAADAARIYWPSVRNFLQIAYDATEKDIGSFLYYRSLSASLLNLPFIVFPEETGDAKDTDSSAEQFLLGFFTHELQDHVLHYIRIFEQELSPDDLRAAADAFEQKEMYAQSMRLVSSYVNRDSYVRNRRDWELLFPRAYTELVEKNAAEFGIDPEILFGLIRTESAFQSSVVSHAGAVGLTQLIPSTAQEMAGRIRRAGGPDFAAYQNGLDLNDPEQNIYIGVYYLNYLLDRFENMLVSLMAYNGGMTRVRRWRAANNLPVDLFMETVIFYETRDYGRKVLGAAEVYKELYYK